MSKERYIVKVEGDFFVDKKDNRVDFFLDDSENDGEWRIDGKLGDCFFSSIEEAREFCTKRAMMDEFLQEIDDTGALEEINFEVCKVGDVLTAQTVKKGKVVSEYYYFDSFEKGVDSFSVNLKNDFEFEKESPYSEFEEIVFKDAFGGGTPFILVSKHVSKWIMDNFDLIRKYKDDY